MLKARPVALVLVSEQNTEVVKKTCVVKLAFFALCPQGLTTELTANSSRIAEINTLADQLMNTDHRHSAAVKKRRKEINDM